jgi:hypothetical protein
MADTKEQEKGYIAALLRERAGYEQQGKTASVAEVDAELARLGAKAATPAKRATKRVDKPAEKRGS